MKEAATIVKFLVNQQSIRRKVNIKKKKILDNVFN